jgi:uncharacterized coiled-coil protein SlyX
MVRIEECNMTTNIPLLERLRLAHMTTSQRMFGEAADVIEAQAKEIHELKIELGEWVQFWRDKDNRALKARIEELEAFIKKQYQQTDALQDRITELEAALEDERERCAKIAERFLSNNEPVRLTANSIAAAIRDRSNEHI